MISDILWDDINHIEYQPLLPLSVDADSISDASTSQEQKENIGVVHNDESMAPTIPPSSPE